MNKLQRIEEMEKQLAALKAEVADEQADIEWPKEDDEYWYISVGGSIVYTDFVADHTGDSFRKASFNCHRTEEEAEAYKRWLTDPRTHARRVIEQCDGFDPLGGFVIECRKRDGRFVIANYTIRKEAGANFTTKEQAQACLDSHRNELEVLFGIDGAV